jgi:hypothetical protein
MTAWGNLCCKVLLERGGTHIHLESTAMAVHELISVARSLVPLTTKTPPELGTPKPKRGLGKALDLSLSVARHSGARDPARDSGQIRLDMASLPGEFGTGRRGR